MRKEDLVMVWNFVFAGIMLISFIYNALAWRRSEKRYKETLANENRRRRMKRENHAEEVHVESRRG